MSKVSIIIPVRNGERFIREAVDSALAQGPTVCEVIVVDDGSTDSTQAILETYAGSGRLRLLSRGNEVGGVSAVRNIGARAAQGEWLMFLDADDRLHDGAIESLLSTLQPNDLAVYGDYRRIDADGRPIGHRHLLKKRQKPSGDILNDLLAGNFIVNGGIMLVRKTGFEAIEGFRTGIAYAEDWLAWCQLAARGSITYAAGKIVLDYRVHQSSVMMKKLLTFEDYRPAVDAVFKDPAILSRLTKVQADDLRSRASLHMEAYSISQALRAKRYAYAMDQGLRFIVRAPRSAPKLAKMSLAALIGM